MWFDENKTQVSTILKNNNKLQESTTWNQFINYTSEHIIRENKIKILLANCTEKMFKYAFIHITFSTIMFDFLMTILIVDLFLSSSRIYYWNPSGYF